MRKNDFEHVGALVKGGDGNFLIGSFTQRMFAVFR